MRAYPEKPRTVTGWTGLLNDPAMDGSHDVHRGLREARRLLVGHRDARPAGCLRMAHPGRPVLPGRRGDLVRDRRAHHREPGAPPARIKPADAGRVQERDRRRRPGRRRGVRWPPRAATRSWASRRPAQSASSPAAAIPTATWSCGAAGPGRTTSRPWVAWRWRIIEVPGCRAGWSSTPATATAARTTAARTGVAVAIAGQIAAGERAIAGVMLESFLVAGRQEPGELSGLGVRPEHHRRVHGFPGHRGDPGRRSPPRSARGASGTEPAGERRQRAHRMAAGSPPRLPGRSNAAPPPRSRRSPAAGITAVMQSRGQRELTQREQQLLQALGAKTGHERSGILYAGTVPVAATTAILLPHRIPAAVRQALGIGPGAGRDWQPMPCRWAARWRACGSGASRWRSCLRPASATSAGKSM